MSELRVRLFVSSPSDVRAERDRVMVVADRLNGALEGVARIDVARWEDSLYSSTRSFQEQIHDAVGGMADIDILICILWGRIGLRLNPALWKRQDDAGYESGTVYEYETALALSRQNKGVPEIYLFRKSAPILYRADAAAEDIEQHRTLEGVWKRWTQSGDGYNAGAFQMFADTDQFERQIERCLEQWLERQGVLVKGPVWDRRLRGSPFRGLAPFEPSHSAVYFGRDAAISRILSKLRAASFLLIIGASGSGKSSLLRAGLLPRVAKPGVVPDIDLWRTAVVVPNDDTFRTLAQALCDESCFGAEFKRAGHTVDHVAKVLRDGGDPAEDIVRSGLAEAAKERAAVRSYSAPRPARLLIAIDQLERLFVEAPSEDVEKFAALLHGLIEQKLAVVIAALRSDAYGSFQAVPAFLDLRETGTTHDLVPPNAFELEEIVTRPVLACHPALSFEVDANGRSLAHTLMYDARGGDSLPLLQLTLDSLYQAEEVRGDGVLRACDYQGMDRAVTQAAAKAYESIDAAARASVPALITAFVLDFALDPATGRRNVTLHPVARARFERGKPERKALVDAFLAHRLLTVDDSGGEIRIRPVHEALLRVWPEAVSVIDENQIVIRVRRTLEPLVAHWLEGGRKPDSEALLTAPALLAGAQQLTERLGEDVAPEMRDYIAASLAADVKRREQEHRRRSAIMSATGKMSVRTIPYYLPLVLALMALAMIVRYISPGPLQELSQLAFDAYQRVSPAAFDPRLPVSTVAIDDASLRQYGQWPWPRTRLSELVKTLAADGAAAIVFDVVFSEPDEWSFEQYIKTLPPAEAELLSRAAGTVPSNDQVFAASLSHAPSVVAVALEGSDRESAAKQVASTNDAGSPASANDCPLVGFGRAGFSWAGDCPAPFLPNFAGASLLPDLGRAALGVGAVTYVPDADNIVRRVSMVDRQGNQLVPSLAAEAIRVAHGEQSQSYTIESSNASGQTSFGMPAGLDSIDIGDIAAGGFHVPTDAHGNLTLRFRHTAPSAFISAAAVLGGKIPAAAVKGRIVFIGLTAPGLVDLHPTPIDAAVPGVEIQQQVAENILAGSELQRPNSMVAVEEFIILVITAILALAMPRVSVPALAVLSGAVLAAVVSGGWALYNYGNLLLDPVYPTLTLVIFITVVTFHIYRHSEAQRRRIRRVYDFSGAEPELSS